MKPAGHGVEIIGADSPSERPKRFRRAMRDPTPKGAPGRLGTVDGRYQLEVRSTKRHDPICRTPAGMTTAWHRGQAVLRLHDGGGRGQVGDRNEHMVKFHTRSFRGSHAPVRAKAQNAQLRKRPVA